VHIDRRKNTPHSLVAGRWAGGTSVLRQAARPAARCEVCPPLFPLTRCAQDGVTVATDRPCSRQQASELKRLDLLGRQSRQPVVTPPEKSQGGISVAIDARVDEAILYLQSSHGQALPARACMHITSPDRFLETFEAFGL
jgi:hypothetical protein